MIREFELISKYDIYSKYNYSLDKKFKDNSLKSFIRSLKSFKPKEKELFLVEFSKKYPYNLEEKKFIDDENEISIRIEEFKRIKEEKEKQRQERLNSPKNGKIELKSSISSKRYNEQDFPDPFKYNPNYNSICKKVPSFKISPKKYGSIKLKKVIKIQIKPNQIKKDKSNLSNSYSSNEENEIYDDNKDRDKSVNSQNFNSVIDIKKFKSSQKENLDLPLITSTNLVKSLKNECNKKLNTIPTDGYRENHALRFSKYLPRKSKLNSINNKLSYVEPHNYALDINKGFDFGKMQ